MNYLENIITILPIQISSAPQKNFALLKEFLCTLLECPRCVFLRYLMWLWNVS